MAKRLTNEQIHARCEAYDEAISHLEAFWTDDPEERSQGDVVIQQLAALRDRITMKLKLDPK